jgi:4-hydroxybenzoate polyprenyltransferase
MKGTNAWSRTKTIRAIGLLFLNHMDAWGITFIISSLALLLHDALNLRTMLLVVGLTVGYWFAFAMNDYWDAPYDAADQRKARRNFFVVQQARPWQVGLVAGTVGMLLLLLFTSFGWRGIAIMAVSLFVAWAYSAPPLRFKGRPGIDLLVHVIFVETFPYLTCLFLAQLPWTGLDSVLLTVLALASLSAQLEQQLRDFDVDAQTGATFATTVGRRPTTILLHASTALLIIVAIVNVLNGTIPLYVAAFGLIALPALLHRFLRGHSKPRSEKLITLSALTGLLYVGFILIFYATRS